MGERIEQDPPRMTYTRCDNCHDPKGCDYCSICTKQVRMIPDPNAKTEEGRNAAKFHWNDCLCYLREAETYLLRAKHGPWWSRSRCVRAALERLSALREKHTEFSHAANKGGLDLDHTG